MKEKSLRNSKIKKAGFSDLVEIMARLRAPLGCPWDREQTHDSIKGHLVEEAFEVIDALDNKDFVELKEELGDLLLQVVFHSQIASEAGRFTIEDVVNDIVAKLERRHPHVFGDAQAETSADVMVHWDRVKSVEKDRRSYLAGVPHALPALALAQKLQDKAARVGFDWPETEGVLAKLVEEIDEFVAADKQTRESEDEFGDILFTLVNMARHLGIDAELALRRVDKKFCERFETMERMSREKGIDFAEIGLVDKEKLWKSAKEGGRK